MGHGSYTRYAGGDDASHRLPIPRFRCRACGHTFGILPSFLVPHRHYSTPLIQRILALLHQLGLSRRQMEARFQGVPALSTCLAWSRSFRAGAHLWLRALLGSLARFDPTHDPLEGLISPLGTGPGPPRLLLDLLPQLVVALRMVAYWGPGVGLSQGLGLLLLWGQGQPLPRLL